MNKLVTLRLFPTMPDTEHQLPTIPHDLIVDILSRLPAKSLLKFRCVSKSWNSLIRNKKFTELHLSRAVKDAGHQRVLLSLKPFWSNDLDDIGMDGCDAVIKQDTHSAFKCLGSDEDFEIIGECNGLVCIMVRKTRKSSGSIHRTFCVWNPSTKECWEISRNDAFSDVTGFYSMFSDEVECNIWFEVFGFGYDSAIDDYKIVRLVSYRYNSDGVPVEVEIFTVGTRTWTKKAETHVCDGFINLRFGHTAPDCSFVNGSFHWIMRRNMSHMVVLSFNLEKELIEEVIPLPDFSKNRCRSSELGVIGGKLVLLTKPGDTEIWAMDEYGVEASWTKLATLCKVSHVEFGESLQPICFSRNGGIFVCVHDLHFVMYDQNDKSYKKADHHTLRDRPHTSTYVESLITPYRVPGATGNS